MATTLLEVNNLNVRFSTDRGTVHAVNGISYTLRAGETLGLVGESGCGKSMSMLSLVRLVPYPGKITCNHILFAGTNIARASDDQLRQVRGNKITIIFQNPQTTLNPVLTIGRQIQEGMELHLGMTAKQSRNRAIELLKMVGIPSPEAQISRYPHQLSGGMLQRVMIASAISCNPQMLIADEPTTALDVTVQAQIIELIKRMRSEINTAIIWVTHDLAIIAGLVDRVLVMYAGYIIEEASVKDLFAKPRHPYTIGLLSSIPRLDIERPGKLTAIKGLPLDLAILPKGCAFYDRCDFRTSKCKDKKPMFEPVDKDHYVACWIKPEAFSTAVLKEEREQWK